MIKFLTKTFIRNSENTTDKTVRQNYCVLGGVLGAICNLFLFALKLVIGTLMNSIAITSDAFNNLSDAGSSIITLIGFKIASVPPDKEHPFGHGRMEYLSGLAVSIAILLMGYELATSSIRKKASSRKVPKASSSA